MNVIDFCKESFNHLEYYWRQVGVDFKIEYREAAFDGQYDIMVDSPDDKKSYRRIVEIWVTIRGRKVVAMIRQDIVDCIREDIWRIILYEILHAGAAKLYESSVTIARMQHRITEEETNRWLKYQFPLHPEECIEAEKVKKSHE